MIITDPICPTCGKPCEVTNEDVGIGAYEYEGQKGNQRVWVDFSKCCYAEIDADHIMNEDDVAELRTRDL